MIRKDKRNAPGLFRLPQEDDLRQVCKKNNLEIDKIQKKELFALDTRVGGSSSKDEGLAMLATNLSAAYVDEKAAQKMSPKRDGSTGAPGLVEERMAEQSIREEVAATVKVVEKKRIADEESARESESKEEGGAAEAAKAVEAAAAAKASVGKKKKQKNQKKETETEMTAARRRASLVDTAKGADKEKSIVNEESESKETGTAEKKKKKKKKKKKVAAVVKVAEEKSTAMAKTKLAILKITLALLMLLSFVVFSMGGFVGPVASQANLLSVSTSGATHFWSPHSSPSGYWQHPTFFENGTACNLCVGTKGSAQVFNSPLEHCFCPPTLTSYLLAEFGVDTLNVSYCRSSSTSNPCGFNVISLGKSYVISLKSTNAPSFLAHKAMPGNHDGQILAKTNVLFNDCSEELHVSMDEEPFLFTQSRCSHTVPKAPGVFSMGGEATAGPAVTGKTETMTDLCNTMGLFEVATHCGDQPHATADLPKIFKGLCFFGPNHKALVSCDGPYDYEFCADTLTDNSTSEFLNCFSVPTEPHAPRHSLLVDDDGDGDTSKDACSTTRGSVLATSTSDGGDGDTGKATAFASCGPFNKDVLIPNVPAVTPDLDVMSLHVEFATGGASAHSVLVSSSSSSSSSLREGGITSTTDLGNPTAVHATTILGTVDQGKLGMFGDSDFRVAMDCENTTPLKTKAKQPPQSVGGSSIALISPPLEFGSRPPTTSPELEPHPLQWAVLIAEAFALVNYIVAHALFAKTNRNKKKKAGMMLGWWGRFLMSPRQARCLLMVFIVFVVQAAAVLPRVPVNTTPLKQAYQHAGSSALYLPHAELEMGPLVASPPPLRLPSEASHWGPSVGETSSSHLEAAALKLEKRDLLLEQMVTELAKEQHIRKAAERHLLQYERGQKPTTTFQGSGGAVPTVEQSLSMILLDNNIMRTGSTSSTEDGPYQREGGGIPATTSIASTSTNTKTFFFSDPMAPARQAEVVAIARRRLATTTVTTEAALTVFLGHDARIELAADILLTSQISIDGLTGVVIDGKGFEIDGQNSVRGFYITGDAEVALSDLTITRCYNQYGGGLYIGYCCGAIITTGPVVTMTMCHVTKNTAGAAGGLYIVGSLNVVTMTSCSFLGNTCSSVYGGAINLHKGALNLVGCTFSGNSADTGGSFAYSGDIFNDAGNIRYYSLCPGGSSYAGNGTLDGYNLRRTGVGLADLSSTSSCVACTALTPFACCGATACSASALTCSLTELAICPNPTAMALGFSQLVPSFLDVEITGFERGFSSGDYGYLVPASGSNSGRVARFELATFSNVQELDLTVADGDLRGFSGGFSSGDYGYLTPGYNGAEYYGKVARFNLATFSNVQVLDLTYTDGDLRGFQGGFSSGDYGYLTPGYNGVEYYGKVARFNLATFSNVQVLDLTYTDGDLRGFKGGFSSGDYAYLVPFSGSAGRFGKVARFDLATFSNVQVLDLTDTDGDLKGFWGGFSAGDYGYLVPNNNGVRSGKVARFDLATFSNVEVLDLTLTDGDLRGFKGGFSSGGYGYLVPYGRPRAYSGKVARFDLATFSNVQVLDLTSTARGFSGGFSSGGYGYLVPNQDQNRMVARFEVDLGAPVSTPAPTVVPTPLPTLPPTSSPSPAPTPAPTATPLPTPYTSSPSPAPTLPTSSPSPAPTPAPTFIPTPASTLSPAPTVVPTPSPTPDPSPIPTPLPLPFPTSPPTSIPTLIPSGSLRPTFTPTLLPTPCVDTVPFCAKTISYCASSFCPTCPFSRMCDKSCDFCADPHPSPQPSKLPAPLPTTQPPSPLPTEPPSTEPTGEPTHVPTPKPSHRPTPIPTNEPTAKPTQQPTSFPTLVPSPFPTLDCAAPSYMFRVEMFAEGTFASGQGGWGALSFGIYSVDGTGATELPAKTTGTLDDGKFGAAFACLPDDCYAFEVQGSPDPAWGMSWAVLETAGQGVIVGARKTRSMFCTVNGLILIAPTLLPTQSQVPSLSPTPVPTLHPVPNPTVPPTMLPTPRPSRRPTRYPSNVPTLSPSRRPTALPSSLPTQPPTPLPTTHCLFGEFLNTLEECEKCEVGRYSNVSNPPWPRECTQCVAGKISPQLGRVADCLKCPVGKFSSPTRDYCGDCQAGDYLFNKTACIKCPFGRYAPTAVNDECVYCSSGFAVNTPLGATRCADCSPGSYSAGGSAKCTSCAPGAASVSRASQCTDCLPGSAAPESGTTACVACAAGSHANMSKAVACFNCPAGKAQSAPGQSSCPACAIGTIAVSTGQSACQVCAPGSVAPNTSSAECAPCAVGKYQGGTGQSACLDCGKGKAIAVNGSTSCASCSSGKYTLSSGMEVCNACPAGTFSAPQASECQQCTPGYFSSAAASEGCSPCASGKVARRSGLTVCELCSSGKSQPASGQINCAACAAGSFSYLEGSASCSDCPGNTFSTSMATECKLCLKNFFYTPELECAECPPGVDCLLDGGSTQEFLTLKPGYWRISPLAAEVYPCELTLACKGGADFDTTPRSRKLRADAQGSDSYCNKGYAGTLCSTCVRNSDGAYFLGTGTESGVKQCLPCGDAKTFIAVVTAPRVIMFLVVLFLAAGLLVASFIKFEPSAKAKKRVRLLTDQLARENDAVTENEDGSKTFTKLFETEGLSTVKQAVSISSSSDAIITKVTTTRVTSETAISTETMVREGNAVQALFQIVKVSQVRLKALIAFFQIVGKIGFNYSLTWPALFEAIVDEFAVFNIDVLSVLGLNCTFKRFDYIDTMLVTTLLPLGLGALLFAAHLFANLQQRSSRKTRAKEVVNLELTEELRAVFTYIEIRNFQEVFLTYATAGSGEIGAYELAEILKEVYSGLSAADAKQRARDMIAAAADIDGNGSISFSKFVTAMHNARHQGQASAFAELVDKVEAKVVKEAGQTTFYAFLTLTFLVLVGTSSTLFNYFKCRSFPEAEGGEESYLFKDYSIDCSSPRYKIFWGYAVLMLLVYPMGIPLLYASLLFEHRGVLGNDEAMDREAAHGFPTTGHLLFLIEAYKPEYLYFEVIECGRRLLLAAVIGIVAADSVASPAIGLCISLFFVYVFTAWQPYRKSSTNSMSVVLAFSLTFFFIAALMIKADLSSDDKSDQKSYGYILTAVLFVGPTTLVFQLTKENAIPTRRHVWRRLCARKEATDEEPTERMAEPEQDMIEIAISDERTVDTLPGSQGGSRDHRDNASTSTEGLARAYSGGSGHFELPKLPRSPHAVAGRRYVTANDNDTAISDDDSTETKSVEQEHQQQLHRPSGNGTSSLHRDRVSIDSLISLDIKPPSTLLSLPSTKKQQSSATRGSNKSAAAAAAAAASGLATPVLGKSPGVSLRPHSDEIKTKGAAEKGAESEV